MTGVPSGLADPPADPAALDGFPAATWIPELHRLSEWPSVWWYASVAATEDAAGGRFDLSRPRGTCYLAESLDGALVEKLLRTPVKVVVAERLDELFHATVTVRAAPATADLTAPAASGFGINAEVHATLDYRAPRRWAEALWRRGWRALRHLLRGDASGSQAGRALFGRAGVHARAPAGMSTTVRPLDLELAEQLLAGRRVEVRPIPVHVPVEPPPT
jgi:hypothetical protein